MIWLYTCLILVFSHLDFRVIWLYSVLYNQTMPPRDSIVLIFNDFHWFSSILVNWLWPSSIFIDFRGFGRMDGPTNGWTDRQMDRRMDWQTHAASRIKKRSSTFNHNCISDPRPRKWRKKNQWEARKRRKKNPALLIGSFFSILVPFDPFHLYQLAKSKICTAPTLTPCFYQFPFLPLPRAPGRYGRDPEPLLSSPYFLSRPRPRV